MSRVTKLSKQYRKQKRAGWARWARNNTKSWRGKQKHVCRRDSEGNCLWLPKRLLRGAQNRRMRAGFWN